MSGAPDRPAPSWRRNFGWAALGNACQAAQQALFVVLLAKLAGPEALGAYALATALVEPPFRLFGLNLRVAQATDLDGRHPFSEYLGLRMATSAVAAGAVFAWSGLSGLGTGIGAALALAVAFRFLESWVEMLHALLQREGSLRQEGRSKALSGVIGLVLSAGVLTAWPSVEAALWVRLGVLLGVLFASDLPAAGRALGGGPGLALPQCRGLPWRRLAVLARTAAPLGWVMFFAALNLSLPRLLLRREEDLAALGVYGGFAQILAAGQVLVAALGAALLPSLARAGREGRRARYLRLLGGAVLVAAALPWLGLPVIALWGGPLLAWVFGPAFPPHVPALLLMLAGGGCFFASSLLAVGMNALRRFSDQAILLPLVCALTYVLGRAWIPAEGVTGAARAYAVSSALLFGLRLLALARSIRRFAPTPPA
jgi:O-antigen/teichoic acid export membrane protein